VLVVGIVLHGHAVVLVVGIVLHGHAVVLVAVAHVIVVAAGGEE
jgi:hypothetical protein